MIARACARRRARAREAVKDALSSRRARARVPAARATDQRGRPPFVELRDGLGLEGLLGQEHAPAVRPSRPRRLPRVQARRQPRRAAARKLEEDQAQRLRGLTGALLVKARTRRPQSEGPDGTNDARQPAMSKGSWRRWSLRLEHAGGVHRASRRRRRQRERAAATAANCSKICIWEPAHPLCAGD